MPVFNEIGSKMKAGTFMLVLRMLQTNAQNGVEITVQMILEKMNEMLPAGLTVDLPWVEYMLQCFGDFTSQAVWLATDVINDDLADNLFSPTSTVWQDCKTFFKGVI